MEKKIRVQLFDQDHRIIDDRMVSQDTEFRTGPRYQHDGPIRVEFSFLEKGDVDDAVIYMQKLTGLLPIEASVKKVKKLKVSDIPDSEETLKAIIEEVKGMANQDIAIKYLREQGFVFMTSEFLNTFGYKVSFKEGDDEEYAWMIRCIKQAKNPINDKYDPMLIFGIKLLEGRTEKVRVYLNGEYEKTLKIPVPEKPKMGFDKTNMLVFPNFMEQEERDKFRYEYRLHEADPNREPSKFFRRWYKHVTKPKEVISSQV